MTLSEWRQFLDSVDIVTAFAQDMSEFLRSGELTETRTFVKEVEAVPGKATIIYTIPTPSDSPIGGKDAAEVALNGGEGCSQYGTKWWAGWDSNPGHPD